MGKGKRWVVVRPDGSEGCAILLARAATARFNALDLRLDEVRTGLNGEISGTVEEINQLATQIARYNNQIAVAESTTGPTRRCSTASPG